MPGLLDRLRQWTWPPELRIPAVGAVSACDGLAELAAELAERCRVLPDPLATAPVQSGPAPLPASAAPVMPELALGLANHLFRLERNVEELAAKSEDSRPLRSVRDIAGRIRDLLSENAIECRDLEGEIFDIGRLDFDALGTPLEIAGLDRPRIGRCERPAIVLDGRLIQKARGVVEKPA